MDAIGWIILPIAVLAIIVVLFATLYQRSTNEVSLVRTGTGGLRIAIDGGLIALPYFQEISRVNMATLRLDVEQRGEASLITQDRLRVDVGAEFYVSVVPEAEAIARAAQTLGKRTFQGDQLRSLIGGMMIDAMRSVAARMTMDELHENRVSFVAEVREMLAGTLGRYGLHLDSVSLTALDQTPFANLDENNAFNAVGMRKLAEVIATSKKERAEIDAESEVSVLRAAMEATRSRLEIELEERKAEIAQQQLIETLAATQIAEVARHKSESERSATQARIEMERSIQKAEVQREQDLAIAEQDRQIALARKSLEESRAKVEAEAGRAEAVTAKEAVETARARAEARRRADLMRIAAQAKAASAAAVEAIEAASEKATAQDRAEALREEAEAKREADLAKAEGRKALIVAENYRSDSQVALQLEKQRLEAMPGILGEMVKPAEKINAINVNHLSGGYNRSPAEGGQSSSMATILDTILEMSVQLPVLKRIGEQMGAALDTTGTGSGPQGRDSDDP